VDEQATLNRLNLLIAEDEMFFAGALFGNDPALAELAA